MRAHAPLITVKPTWAVSVQISAAWPGVRTAAACLRNAWVGSRGQRVLCMLAALWVFHAFDYAFTVLCFRHGLADECNPIAAHVLGMGPAAALFYKVLLVGVGTPALVLHRRSPLTEVLTTLALLALLAVVLRWKAMYDLYELIQLIKPPGYIIGHE